LWRGMISQPLKGLLFQLIGNGTTCKECYEVYEYQGAYVNKNQVRFIKTFKMK